MRIAHILDRADIVGGVQTYLGHLIPALRGRGVESVIVTGAPGDAVESEFTIVPGVACDGPVVPESVRDRLCEALREIAPDLVVQHVAMSPGVTEVAAQTAPVVVHAHDYFMACPGGTLYLHRSAAFCSEGYGLRCFRRAYTERTTNRRPDRLARAYARTRAWDSAWQHARAVLVASEFVADVHVRRGIPADIVHVVGYPVPLSANIEPAADPPDLLFVGRLADSKGVHVLIDALTELDGVTLAIGGDGPARAHLERRARDRGVAGRVQFLGWVNPSRRNGLMRGAKVFVLPSLWDEPFGIVGVEALGAGTPVVASDVGGVASWLDDGRTGVLVPRGDARALAHALSTLLTDEPRRRAYAASARVAAQRHSLDAHLATLLPALGIT